MLRKETIAALAVLFVGACALVSPARGPMIEHLDEVTVRAFLASEQAAWNAHDFDRYYALCAPDATFLSVRWNGDGSITRKMRTLEEDRAEAEHYFKDHPGRFSETDAIDRIVIARDGRSARILGHETARIEGERGTLRATTEETVVLRNGRALCLGQIDTQVR